MEYGMTDEQFLQAYANLGMSTITKKEFAKVRKISDYRANSILNKLREKGIVWLVKNGRYSYWEIDLSYNGPYISKERNNTIQYDKALSFFQRTSLTSMRLNCTRETVYPDDTDLTIQEQDLVDSGYNVFYPD